MFVSSCPIGELLWDRKIPRRAAKTVLSAIGHPLAKLLLSNNRVKALVCSAIQVQPIGELFFAVWIVQRLLQADGAIVVRWLRYFSGSSGGGSFSRNICYNESPRLMNIAQISVKSDIATAPDNPLNPTSNSSTKGLHQGDFLRL
jgi:hypothetical protein